MDIFFWPKIAKKSPKAANISQIEPKLVFPYKYSESKNVTVKTYQKLSKDHHGHIILAKSCQKLPKVAKSCQNLPKFANISQIEPKLVFPSKYSESKNVTVKTYQKLSKDHHGHIFLAKSSQKSPKVAKSCQKLPKFANISQIEPKLVFPYKSKNVIVKTYQKLAKDQRGHIVFAKISQKSPILANMSFIWAAGKYENLQKPQECYFCHKTGLICLD